MAIPTFTCELALGYNPGDAAPVWTDVSAYLRSFNVIRGREYELNQMQAGTCRVVLKNTDRRFDPTYASSPYYPNLRPMLPIRISATLSSTTYRVFTGYVERFPQMRTGPTYAETQIQAVDGFELLTNSVLPAATYPQELSGARISRVLNAANWSTSARSIGTGQSTIAAYTFADADLVQPLAHIQDVADSELGLFFMAHDGKATFIDRATLSAGQSAATFTDQPSVDVTAIGYADIVASYDKDLIVNDWRGTRTGGVMQEALDSQSITRYFQRTQSKTPLLTTDADVLSQMQYLLSQYKEPALRFDQVTITPGASTTAWTQVLTREIGDRITVKEHPPGGGTLTQDELIQQVDITVLTHAANATVKWGLLNASLAAYFLLDNATSGTLDNNKVGY